MEAYSVARVVDSNTVEIVGDRAKNQSEYRALWLLFLMGSILVLAATWNPPEKYPNIRTMVL